MINIKYDIHTTRIYYTLINVMGFLNRIFDTITKVSKYKYKKKQINIPMPTLD